MNYKTRDKIGATIWFFVFGLCILIVVPIIFSPIIIGRIYNLPLWATIPTTIVLFFTFGIWIPIQEWLEQFEEWLRKKLNL